MALEASAYAAFALTTTIAFGLISVSAFVLLNALSMKLHEKEHTKKLMRTQVVYSMRSTEAQRMRDHPDSLYRTATVTYIVFCLVVLALLALSHFCCKEFWDVVLSLLFVVVCLGYTGWVVFRVSIASRNFISAFKE